MNTLLPAPWRHALPALLAMLATLCLACAPAQGQVLRCTDPRTGAVSYTDGTCDTGRQAKEVVPARSPEDIAREREQAAQAIARKEQLLREEAAAAAAAAARPPPAPTQPHGTVETARCAQSRQQLQKLLNRPGDDAQAYSLQITAAQRQMELDCLGPQAYGELEQSRNQQLSPTVPYIVVPPRPLRPSPPARPLPRPEITHCNVFRCYDRQGNIYPR